MLYLSDCNTIQHGGTNSLMSTQCNTNQLEFLPFKSSTSNERTRRVLGRFDADKVSSDGGVALLREAEHRFGIIRRLSECFTDHRDPRYITHTLFSIAAQRVLAICCGYEDVNDHDRFRSDPLASMFCGTSSRPTNSDSRLFYNGLRPQLSHPLYQVT